MLHHRSSAGRAGARKLPLRCVAMLPTLFVLPATACSDDRRQDQTAASQPTPTKAPQQPSTASGQPTVEAPQGPWRGLQVPAFPGAAELQVDSDTDEYELYFLSADQPRAVFDFYRAYLEQQGFRMVKEEAKQHGHKANFVRGQGGAGNAVELDAKLKGGRHKVEIEFDD